MEVPKTEISKIYTIIASILLAPIILPCILIITVSVVIVCLMVMIPALLIALVKDGGGLLIDYIKYKKQMRKIMKDFVGRKKEAGK